MGEKKEHENVNIDSTNIFDEFGVDEKTKKEVEGMEKEKNKNLEYYIRLISNFFTFINMIILLIFIVLAAYIYIQNDETIKDAAYLTPVCSVFEDDKGDYENCSSVTALIGDYTDKNNSLSKQYYNQNLPLIESVFKNLRFIDSKEVSFLINKSKDKLRVLDIISKFDKIKNDFSPLSKTRIKCYDLDINLDDEVTMQCSAYSGEWTGKIPGFSGKNNGTDKVHGTSISVASSFINFIEKIKNPDFLILEKPKKFNFVEIVDNNGYTKKTDFKLKLKYINNISSPKK